MAAAGDHVVAAAAGHQIIAGETADRIVAGSAKIDIVIVGQVRHRNLQCWWAGPAGSMARLLRACGGCRLAHGALALDGSALAGPLTLREAATIILVCWC
jgi:hypothetical protein